MFKNLAVTYFVFLTTIALIAYVFFSENITLTLLTSLNVLILNFFGLFFIWKQIIKKKSIALAAGIIILKYPILGYLVIKLTRQSWFSSLGLILGFISFLVYILLVAFLKQKKKL